MLDRNAIATALSSVDGVQGFSYRPSITNPGDGWPLSTVLNRTVGSNYEALWKVVVVLPNQTEQEALTWYDEKFQEIADALEAEDGYVEQIEPGNLEVEGGSVKPCMIITYRNEA